MQKCLISSSSTFFYLKLTNPICQFICAAVAHCYCYCKIVNRQIPSDLCHGCCQVGQTNKKDLNLPNISKMSGWISTKVDMVNYHEGLINCLGVQGHGTKGQGHMGSYEKLVGAISPKYVGGFSPNLVSQYDT